MWGKKWLGTWNRFRIKRYWNSHPALRILVYVVAAVIIGLIIGFAVSGGEKDTSPSHVPSPEKEVVVKEVVKEVERKPEAKIFKISASDAYLVGEYGNNIQWDGHKVKQINGTASIKIDPYEKIGEVIANFNGSINPHDNSIMNGDFRIEFTHFKAEEKHQNGGIATEVGLFGGSGNGDNDLPYTNAFLAGWGRADLFLDDQSLEQDMHAFFAVTEGMRRDGKIQNINGTSYRPKLSDEIDFTDPKDRELHIWVRSNLHDEKNFPSYDFVIYLYFEDVNIEDIPKGFKI